MNVNDLFKELQEKFPTRAPGSLGVTAVIQELERQTSTWSLSSKTEKVTVFPFQTAVGVFGVGSLMAILIGLWYPLWGVFLTGLLLITLLLEFALPILARFKTSRTENFSLTIPARSKETQRVFLIMNLSTDDFIAAPKFLNSEIYLLTLFGLGVTSFLLELVNLLLPLRIFTVLATVPILILLLLAVLPRKENAANSSLNNCAAVLELGSILTKAKPSTTTVTIFASGSRSLNSGVLGLLKQLKTGPQLTYVVNLVDLADKRINVITDEGAILSQPNDPLLVELLMEVSREKSIPVQTIKIKEFTAVLPLKLKQIRTVSVANPLLDATELSADKNVKELLIGLIRKLDH